METITKSRDIRISVKTDEALKDELTEVATKTRLSESTIVREAVQEKLAQLRQNHPAYQVETA